MTPIKAFGPKNVVSYSAETGEVIHLSWATKNLLHKMARSLISPLHVFDYDTVSIIQHKPPKLTGTVKLYESTFDVLLSSGKKVKYSVSSISLTKDGYRPYIKELPKYS